LSSDSAEWSFGSARWCAYVACYLVFVASGRAAARLAADFRTIGAIGNRLGPIPILLQFPILACWLVVRPISIAAFATCCALAPVSSRAPSA
jgi:hypothetical protein